LIIARRLDLWEKLPTHVKQRKLLMSELLVRVFFQPQLRRLDRAVQMLRRLADLIARLLRLWERPRRRAGRPPSNAAWRAKRCRCLLRGVGLCWRGQGGRERRRRAEPPGGSDGWRDGLLLQRLHSLFQLRGPLPLQRELQLQAPLELEPQRKADGLRVCVVQAQPCGGRLEHLRLGHGTLRERPVHGQPDLAQHLLRERDLAAAAELGLQQHQLRGLRAVGVPQRLRNHRHRGRVARRAAPRSRLAAGGWTRQLRLRLLRRRL
jgi:hypothetical protein